MQRLRLDLHANAPTRAVPNLPGNRMTINLTPEEFAHIFGDPRVKPEGEDPYTSADYQRFVESMLPHCHCEIDRPCDGVLAGGLCDGRRDEREDDRDSNDSPLDPEDRNEC